MSAAEEPTGEEIVLASQRGIALNTVWLEGCVHGMQQVMGEDFIVSATGIQLAEGHTPNKDEITERISNLAKGTENVNVLKATIMWGFGDLCIIAEQFGNADEVIAQAVKTTGQSKHLIQQAIRMCKFFPQEKRVAGWSLSHHAEITNHAGRFKDNPGVLEAVMAEARKGKETTTISPDGTEITSVEPISCSSLRAMLQEASGQPVGEGSRTLPKDRFLYVMEGGQVRKSSELSKEALKLIDPIINLDTMTVVGGTNQGPVQNLESYWFPTLGVHFEQEVAEEIPDEGGACGTE